MKHGFGPWGSPICSTAFAVAVTLPTIPNFRQPCRVNDTPLARLVAFHSYRGSRPTREYTPITAYNGALTSGNPAYWFANSVNDPAPVDTLPGPAFMHLTVKAPYPEFLILNLRNYPSWRIARNGEPMPHTSFSVGRYDGLIAFQLPAGASTIDISYIQPFDQSAGDIISFVSLVLLAFIYASPSKNVWGADIPPLST